MRLKIWAEKRVVAAYNLTGSANGKKLEGGESHLTGAGGNIFYY